MMGGVLLCQKTTIPLSVKSLLNISQLEAALPAAPCSRVPPLLAGSVVQQLEVLQVFGSLWCDGPFQRIYKLADADLPTLQCSSVHSVHASGHGWLRLRATHVDLSSSLFHFPVAQPGSCVKQFAN